MYELNFGPVLSNFEELMQGLWTTIYLSVSAMILGLLVSIVCAIGKTSGGRLGCCPASRKAMRRLHWRHQTRPVLRRTDVGARSRDGQGTA